MRQMLEEYVPHVYRFAVRLAGDMHAAEDLTQEVMLRAWRRRRDLRDPRSARVWLLRIAANLWKDQLRKRRSAPHVALISAQDPVRVAGSPLSEIMRKEEVRKAMESLDNLPDRQRNVVYLHVCEGLELREVADVLEISYSAAKASLCVGRRRLRSELKDVYRRTDVAAKKPE